MSRTHRSRTRPAEAPAPPARPARWSGVVELPDEARTGLRRGPRDKTVRIGRTGVGKGVFARRHYRPAGLIGEILGEVIDDPDYGSRYCLALGDGRVLEPRAPFRYVNHSCDPNCEFNCVDLTTDSAAPPARHVFLIALRAIRPGEELTIDYNWPASVAIPCRCGSPECRGWIVDAAELALVTGRASAPQGGPAATTAVLPHRAPPSAE